MEPVCHFDIELQQHIITHIEGSANYFSLAMQNELIALLANQVSNGSI